MKERIKRTKEVFRRRPLIDFSNYRRTVLLAGSGRSGTTWVASTINYNHAYRLMFEPFHTKKVCVVRKFRYLQYLRPDNRDPELLAAARTILCGRLRNDWIDQYNTKLVATRRLVKDIRANHLLKWIKNHFPEIPVILLLRHPCAVAYSRMALGWQTHLEEFLSQPELMEDFLDPFEREIGEAADVFDKHILMWCIENYIPLRQFRANEVHVVFYEWLSLEPRTEVERLFSFIGKPYDSGVFSVINKPSLLARKDSAVRISSNVVHEWKSHVTEAQVERAIEILRMFGLEKLYSEDPLPRVQSGESPLRA